MTWNHAALAYRPFSAKRINWAHHEGAHISCGLVVDDDHGFFFRDGPYVIAPLRYFKRCRAPSHALEPPPPRASISSGRRISTAPCALLHHSHGNASQPSGAFASHSSASYC
ncbi:hypothetical protein EYF80_013681 [Liparis tanakae]|uniref:Uncharacterized protein n=1 Tax=Liparis tanakae TaxID=230148 RepID=A0A4Z2IDV6_9TELE|nr:hypothetical protein EYF80_013681 [Liparis tanakae]